MTHQLVQRLTNTGTLQTPLTFSELIVTQSSGSAVFDGTSYMQAVSNLNDYAFGSGDFTIEWYHYQTQLGGAPRVFSIGTYPNAFIGASVEGGGAVLYFWLGSSAIMYYPIPDPLNRWIHVAFVRSSNVCTMYVNGQAVNTTSNGFTFGSNSTNLTIGAESNLGSRWYGNITGFQYVVGTALYTSSFTPPSLPLSPATGSKLLLNMSDAGSITTDSSGQNQTVISTNVAWSDSVPGTLPALGITNTTIQTYTMDEVSFDTPGIITDNLYAWFDSDNINSYPGTGYTWYDISGNGWNANLQNVSWVAGPAGGMGFDGYNSKASTNITDPGNGNMTNAPITFCFWLNDQGVIPQGVFDTAPGQTEVLRQWNAGSPNNSVEWWNGNPAINAGIVTGTWMHWAVTYYYDGNRHVASFVNGEPWDAGNGDYNPAYAWTNLILGCINDNSNWYSGYIGQMQIYKARLTTQQIHQNYMADAARYGLIPADPQRRDLPNGTVQVLGHFDEVSLSGYQTEGLIFHVDAGNPTSYPGSGDQWYDISGSGRNVTMVNTPTWDSRGWLNWNGTNQYGTMSPGGLPSGNHARTMAGWCKWDGNAGSWRWIMSYGADPWSDYGIQSLGISASDQWCIGDGTTNQYDGSVTNLYDAWVFLVSTYDGHFSRLYLNGELVVGDTFIPYATQTNTAYVSAQANGNEHWNGGIAKLWIYDRCLPDTDIALMYEGTKPSFADIGRGTQFWVDGASYSGSGTTWADLSDNHSNLTLYNGPAWNASNCGYFSFNSGLIQSSYTTAGQAFYHYTNEMTVAWWFRRNGGLITGAGIGQGTVGVESMADNMWLMHGNGNDNSITFYVNNGGAWVANTSQPFADNTWYFMVGTINSFQQILYVDGVSQSVTAAGISVGIVNNPNSTIAVGQDVRYNSNRFFNGDIAYARVWNRALSAGEVALLYAQTQGCFV